MTTLDDVQAKLLQLSNDIGAAVVGVGHRWALGSGVVVGPGRVLTNAHNLRRDEVTVTFADGRTAAGKPAGVDVDGDVAVLEVDTGDTPTIEWNGNSEVGIGTPVFALANPGGRGLRVTFGFVSGTERSFRGPRGRRISGSVEHTAPLLPGSSGGPIVDGDGHFLGLNTNRLGEGFYLAIPADTSLKEKVDRLAAGASPRTPRLGVAIAPPEVGRRLRKAVGLPEADGLLVRGVEEGSPAAGAGILEGDLLIEAAGRALDSADTLFEVLEADGSSLTMKLLRGAEEHSVEIRFGG